MAYRVAVVGATGAVGREMIKTLVERDFPVSDIVALASEATSQIAEDRRIVIDHEQSPALRHAFAG